MADKDVRKYLVVKGNDLIQKAKFNLSETEQKLVAMCIASIKPDATELPNYKIRVDKFAALCGVSKKHLYTDFREIVDKISEKAVWVKMPDGKVTRFNWFPYASYYEGEGYVELSLHKDLKPYLLDMHKNFTGYEIWNILCLRGKYSIRLYELMASYLNLGTIEIPMDQLRESLCAENYKNFKDFKARVLEKSIIEINQKTNLTVNYETKRGGRGGKVASIVFTIDTKPKYLSTAAYEQYTEQFDDTNTQVVGQMSMFDFINDNRD